MNQLVYLFNLRLFTEDGQIIMTETYDEVFNTFSKKLFKKHFQNKIKEIKLVFVLKK